MNADADDDADELMPGGKGLTLLLLTLALAGLALNLLLLFRHLPGGGIAGCGGGSACNELLNSRWSQIHGIPVTLFGALIYLALVVSLAAGNRLLVSPLLGVLAGVAAWFAFVQAVLLGSYCPWCMAAHGVGVGLAVLGLWRQVLADHTEAVWMKVGVSATAAVLTLAVSQYYGSGPAAYRMDEVKGLAASQAAAIYSRGEGPKAVFADGRRIYNVAALPHLGRADARCVMVEYLDYRCPACLTMRGFLDAFMAKHPAELCVVILPVPLERSCNFSLGEKDTQFPGSCKLAKLALALWRIKPEAFAGFHHFLLGGVSTEVATARVMELIPAADLFAALRDPWIDELIETNVNDCSAFSAANKKLPKLLVSGKRILHGLPSGPADFIRVMERELGL